MQPSYRQRSSRSAKGVTLVELLIALAIFGLLLSMVSFATLEGLKFNARQQATVAAQSKLRRVTGAISQDVRGALFGSVADLPTLTANNSQVAFYVADQGAGYEVITTSNSQFQMVADADPGIGAGGRMILFDSSANSANSGQALVFPVSGAVADSGTGVFTVPHASCSSTLALAANTRVLAYGARSLGIRHDPTTNRLLLTENGVEVPLAYNVTDFEVDYVYRVVDEAGNVTIESLKNPRRAGSKLLRVETTGSSPNVTTHTLVELQLTISAREPSAGGKFVTRTSISQIPLVSPNVDGSTDFSFQGINPC